jgi:transcriptional regulator with XRE-family HTH domain
MTTITAATCRAARGLVDLTQRQLAEAARIGLSTVKGFEGGHTVPGTNNLLAIRSALEAAGVEFIDENGGGAGVRLRRVRKFEEVSGAGLTTGRIAFVADLRRFDEIFDREHWREVAFDSEKEREAASGFRAVVRRAIAEGYAIAG